MPWIVTTGQAWKLKVFYVLIVLTGTLFARFVLSYNGIEVMPGLGEARSPALFLTIGIGAFLWLLLSIQCPTCDALPVWIVLREVDASRWLLDLSQSDRCPVCGQQGSPVRQD